VIPASDPVSAPVAPTVRNHRRFALTGVTFGDQPVGGATVDVWEDAMGATWWCARVLMPTKDMPQAGVLAGRTRDGRILRGPVSLLGPGPTLRPRGPVLVEWRGVGALSADDAPESG